MEAEHYSLFFPSELLAHFSITLVQELGEVSSKQMGGDYKSMPVFRHIRNLYKRMPSQTLSDD